MVHWKNLSSSQTLLKGSYIYKFINFYIIKNNRIIYINPSLINYLFLKYCYRWDITAVDQLPYYMKICFFALHNSINDMAFEVLKEQGFHIIKYLKKAVPI